MGSVIGGLSLGLNGIIFAVAGTVAIFLRVALGYSEKGGPFKEALSIRMSVATLSGFVVAVFEVLFSGLSEASLLFGLSMILLSPILTFIFSGMFTEKVPFNKLVRGETDLFSLNDMEKNEK